MTIDYSKLNDRIVRQAYDHSTAFLTKTQKEELVQNKIKRVEAMLRARDQVYHQIED
jgi:hypothetical protein